MTKFTGMGIDINADEVQKNLEDSGFVTDHYNGAIRVMTNPKCQPFTVAVINEVTREVSYYK